MAERRMFTRKVVCSDAFIDLPFSSQALYLQLNMEADDDGFIAGPKKIQRMIGASDEDLERLISKKFVIAFEDKGLVVIKHWKMHNYIAKDRYKGTVYTEEKNLLKIKENKSYKLLDTNCIQDVYKMDTQVRLGKDRLGKVRIGKDRLGEDREEETSPTLPQKSAYGKYNNVFLSDYQLQLLQTEFPKDYEKKIDRLSSYMQTKGKSYEDHYATICEWAKQDEEKQTAPPYSAVKCSNPFLSLAKGE